MSRLCKFNSFRSNTCILWCLSVVFFLFLLRIYSTVAIKEAVDAIQNGDCDMAIAGGVNVLLSPRLFISFLKAGMLSKDGRCKTFDKSANGYVRGEGSGALLLKSLFNAENDRDQIYGVIKGVSENHGGHATSLIAPNPNAQAELIIDAYEKAEIPPEKVSYIEAHGTGTELGDPIEINGLKKAYRELYKRKENSLPVKQYCGIGSVKTNIGHLEAAAGIAGVLKVLLAMKFKKLPKTVHFKEINPYIELKESPFYIVDNTRQWVCLKDNKGLDIKRIAGISSFGFGGTNAHVVIEEYEDKRKLDICRGTQMQGEYIFILSAKNEERLKEYAGKMVHYLEGEESKKVALKDIVYTLQTGREEMEERLAVIAMSKEEIIKKLKFFLQKAEKGEIERVIRGSDKYNKKAKTEKELKSRDRSIMLQSLIESNDFTKIALLWTQGVDIDWDLLYQKETPCFKTSLPGYPFKKERHWFDSEKIIDESQNKEIQKLNIPGKKNKTPVPVIHQFYPDKKDLTFNIKDKIRNELASVLYRNPSDIDENSLFADSGLDSILGVELIKRLNKIFNINIKAIKLYDYYTLHKLSEYIAQVVHDKRKESFTSKKKEREEKKEESGPSTSMEYTLNHERDESGLELKRYKAVLIKGVGDIKDLELENINIAAPDADEVQILVKASGLNFPDILCVQGLYPTMPDYPFVPGFEVSGIVIKTGSSVKKFKKGDHVIALTGKELGGHSEVVNTHMGLTIKKPDAISFEQASVLPVAFLTAYYALYEIGRLRKGEHVLIQTAAGGVGLAAVQLSMIKQAFIYGTSSSPEKLEYLKSIGVHHVINYEKENSYNKIMEITHGRGVDIVLNTLIFQINRKIKNYLFQI